jgi:hypothetical protein
LPQFPLPAALAALHNDTIGYAAVVQNRIAARGGCQNIASEALNALAFSAIIAHRSVRTVCEEGWTPIASILNRTLLDIFANCVAVVSEPKDSDFMGFKYLTHFQRKWLKDPAITDAERTGVTANIEEMVSKLQPADQTRARELLAESEVTPYWFQPQYGSPKKVLALSPHPVYEMYRYFSGPTHGGYSLKIILNDDPASEDIEPREHPVNLPNAILGSSKLLLEVCFVRDRWDNEGVGGLIYEQLSSRLNVFRDKLTTGLPGS